MVEWCRLAKNETIRWVGGPVTKLTCLNVSMLCYGLMSTSLYKPIHMGPVQSGCLERNFIHPSLTFLKKTTYSSRSILSYGIICSKVYFRQQKNYIFFQCVLLWSDFGVKKSSSRVFMIYFSLFLVTTRPCDWGSLNRTYINTFNH